ncbi:MAG: TolC family protein [Desulfuromonadales bacterium]
MLRILIALAVLIMVPGGIRAQTVELREALAEAVRERPFARAERARSEAAEAAADAAGGRYLPHLTLQENYQRTSQPGNGLFIALNQEAFSLDPSQNLYTTRENFMTRLSLRQPLINSAIYFGQRQARQESRAAQAMAAWSEEQAAFAVFRAYIEVQQARAARESAQSSHAEASEVLRLARLSYETGVGLRADQLRAKVALSKAERRLLTVRNDLKLARRGLALALGRSEGEVGIAETLTPDLFAEEVGMISIQRGDLEAMSHRSEAMREAQRGAKAAYLPKLNASAAYEMHDPETPFGNEADHWTVNVGLSWTVFDGFQRENQRAMAAAQLQASRQAHMEAARKTQLQVEEAVLRAAEAESHLETAQKAVAEADESHRLLQQRYEAGLSDLSDLLAVRAALDQARTDAVEAESRLILALGNIRFQKGVFLQTLLGYEEIIRE